MPGGFVRMNTIVHPFLADGGEGYLAAMAQIELMKAYVAAGIVIMLAFLPWWRRGTRWLCLGFASVSSYLVIDSYRDNDPLPWTLAVLFFPLAMPLTGVILSWRRSRRFE